MLRLNLLFFRSGRWTARGRSSAVAHLWYLHGQLYEFSRLLTRATAVTVQLQLVVAAILLLLISLAGWLDVPVGGEAAAHGPLTRSRQEDHHLVETAVQTGENQSCAVICRQWRSKMKRRGSTLWGILTSLASSWKSRDYLQHRTGRNHLRKRVRCCSWTCQNTWRSWIRSIRCHPRSGGRWGCRPACRPLARRWCSACGAPWPTCHLVSFYMDCPAPA